MRKGLLSFLTASFLMFNLMGCSQQTPVKGDQGDKGDTGEKGSDGLTPYIGENGNWYIGDQDTLVPAQGNTGAKGKDGSSLLSGEGVPSIALGNEGDLYLDLSSWDVYSKTSSGWTKTGNIKGQDGENGKDGVDGQNGQDGLDGVDGHDGKDGENGKDGLDGTDGKDGQDGSSLLSGDGVPAFELGNEGDFYIDLDTYDIYVKTSSGWTKTGNIKGQDGENGSAGRSAYEIYKDSFPGYTGSESDWIRDLALGNLSVTVSFDTLGGQAVESLVYCKGDTIDPSAFSVAYKENETFEGWYYDSSYLNPVSTSFVALNDITLYARYQEKEHTKGTLLSVLTDSSLPECGLFTCATCGETYYDSISYEDIQIPILKIEGDYSQVSKENKTQMSASYEDGNQSFDADITIKFQGTSSLAYPKKNFNIQLFEPESEFSKKKKVELVDGWGKQSKYTLKANYIDFSQSRNVVAGDIWGDIVRARENDTPLKDQINGGAVDGFPILIYWGGAYQGLYTLNIPKDEWMFGLTGEGNQALLSTSTWSQSVKLYTDVDFNDGWEIEYCSTDDTSWVPTRLNELIAYCNLPQTDDFKAGLPDYVDLEASLDYFIYITLLCAMDNSSKNMLWVTYDGTTWSPSVYDLDDTFGMDWAGEINQPTTWSIPNTGTHLWERIWGNYLSEMEDRYEVLRNGAFSLQNIDAHFVDFFKKIPSLLWDSERNKWTGVPSQTNNNLSQILNYIKERCAFFDDFWNAEVSEDSVYKVTFDDNNLNSIHSYLLPDTSSYSMQSNIAFARDSSTGYITDSDGQVNFSIDVPEGYQISSIDVSGSYKNLKTPADTGIENLYRITKISSDLSVKVNFVALA